MKKSVRIIVIVQLCLAFTLICWIAGKPFSQDHLAIKTRAGLYQFAMGIVPDNKDIREEVKKGLLRNENRFKDLPVEKQNFIKNDYQQLHDYASRPFSIKFQESLRALFIETSPFVQAWIFFSICISILMLFSIEGAYGAVWLIPVITFCYAADNYLNHPKAKMLPEDKLFPSEEIILSKYLNQPLSQNIFDQKDQLLTGWRNYLVKDWSGKSANEESFLEKVEQGEFAFTIGRLSAIHEEGIIVPKNTANSKENWIVLLIYVGWNSYFAWFVNKKSLDGRVKDKLIVNGDAWSTGTRNLKDERT